jgi:hypothetical protein
VLFKLCSKHLFAYEEASNNNNDEEVNDSPSTDDCDVNNDNNDLHGFLSLVGSLQIKL